MNAKIQQVTVRDLGPISSFTQEFNLINLIYGHNEVGKTHLVEFIIRSLFQNPKNWSLRESLGKGKVIVSGLTEKLVEFSPENPKKIEDFWEESSQSFPQDFSKLLVVKAAEVALAENKMDIDTTILKNYLSGRGLLDIILDNIPSTIKQASIEDNQIVGYSRGDIKRLNEVEDQLAGFKELEEKISNQLSQGELIQSKNKLKEVNQNISKLEDAKRYRAYQVNEEIFELKNQISIYSDEEIEEITKKISNREQLNALLCKEEEQLVEAKVRSKEYNWLKEAKRVYEKRQAQPIPKHFNIILIISAILLALAIYFYVSLENWTLLGIPFRILSIISLGLSIVSVAYYAYSLNRLLKRKVDFDDISEIENGYKEKFNNDFFGLVDVNEKLEEIQPYFFNKQTLENSISEKKRNLNQNEREIISAIKNIYDKKFKFEEATEIIKEIKTKFGELKEKINSLEKELASLDIKPEYYIHEKQPLSWDLKKYEVHLEEREKLEEDIDEKEQALIIIKQSAHDFLGTEITDNWENVIWKTEEQIYQKEKEFNELKSKCIAQIIITKVGEGLQKSEDEKIQEGLQSSKIKKYINMITKKYSDIEYRDESLYLKDKFEEFKLNDLSTGTVEQLFLALRVGFAAKATGDQGMFLILDDAFQYSDWERRPRLVDLVLDLAKEDWQIIYFSMDDHIRDLFVDKTKGNLRKKFSLIELN